MPAKKGKDLAELFNTHDIDTIYPERMRKALAEMARENPEAWEYEIDFFRRAGVQAARAIKFCDKFAAHIVVVPQFGSGRDAKRVWFGSPAVAKKARAKFPKHDE